MTERKDLDYLARIARIEIPESEAESHLADLREALRFVDAIRRADVDGVAPLAHARETTLRLRDDVVAEESSPQRAAAFAAAAPKFGDGHFLLPKVVS